MTSRPDCTLEEALTGPADRRPAHTSPDQPAGNGGQRGASLVEYALLLALVAIVCIGGVTLIGRATVEPLSSAASMFGG